MENESKDFTKACFILAAHCLFGYAKLDTREHHEELASRIWNLIDEYITEHEHADTLSR